MVYGASGVLRTGKSGVKLFTNVLQHVQPKPFYGFHTREQLLRSLPEIFQFSPAAAQFLEANRSAFRGRQQAAIRDLNSGKGGEYTYGRHPHFEEAARLFELYRSATSERQEEAPPKAEVFMVKNGMLRSQPLQVTEFGPVFMDGAHLVVFGTEVSNSQAIAEAKHFADLNSIETLCFIKTDLKIGDWKPTVDKNFAPDGLTTKLEPAAVVIAQILPHMSTYNTHALMTGRTLSTCTAHSGGCVAVLMATSMSSQSALANLRVGLFAPILPWRMEYLLHDAQSNAGMKVASFRGMNDLVDIMKEKVNTTLSRRYPMQLQLQFLVV